MTIATKSGPIRRLLAVIFAFALIAAACGSDDDETDTSSATTEEPAATTTTAEPVATTGEPATTTEEPAPTTAPLGADGLPVSGSAERCEANRAAGKMTFLTGFDFAASAGILEVVAAEAEGYFDEMCLDVEIQSGLSPQNSASVAAGATQVSAVSSFGELVQINVNGEADLIVFSQLGHTSISELVVPAGTIETLADLEGKTMGIKGDIPSPVVAMLASEGLDRGQFEELLLDGFDPIAHLELGIDALPVFRSNEPATLRDAGIDFVEFDPFDFDVPASFALYLTSSSFYAENPTAIEDFVRAGLRGFHWSAANPEAAVAHAFELIEVAGNQFFLFEPHETDKWIIESTVAADTLPDGFNIGQLNPPRLGEEVQLLTDLGVLDSLPDWESMMDASVVPKLYDDSGELIWEPMG